MNGFQLVLGRIRARCRYIRYRTNTTGTECYLAAASGRIFVLHVPGLSELQGIEFSSLLGKLSPETFDNVSET